MVKQSRGARAISLTQNEATDGSGEAKEAFNFATNAAIALAAILLCNLLLYFRP